MATISKTMEQIEDFFRDVVIKILRLPENDESVRFPYGSNLDSENNEESASGSAPDFERTDNVCFIYILPDDDGYGEQTHISYRDDGAGRLTEIDQHTDVYRVNFVCYGPSAAQRARALERGLVRQEIREYLNANYFYLVSKSPRAIRVPEARNGAWWNRWDLTSRFYAYVCIETPDSVGVIETVPIKPISERST